MMLVKVQLYQNTTLHCRIIYQVKQRNYVIHAVWLQLHLPVCRAYGVLPQYIESIYTKLLDSNRGWCVCVQEEFLCECVCGVGKG